MNNNSDTNKNETQNDNVTSNKQGNVQNNEIYYMDVDENTDNKLTKNHSKSNDETIKLKKIYKNLCIFFSAITSLPSVGMFLFFLFLVMLFSDYMLMPFDMFMLLFGLFVIIYSIILIIGLINLIKLIKFKQKILSILSILTIFLMMIFLMFFQKIMESYELRDEFLDELDIIWFIGGSSIIILSTVLSITFLFKYFKLIKPNKVLIIIWSLLHTLIVISFALFSIFVFYFFKFSNLI